MLGRDAIHRPGLARCHGSAKLIGSPCTGRVAVDQARLSRLATQSAIERSRTSLAETRALLIALRYAVRGREVEVSQPRKIDGEAAMEARRLLAALTMIQKNT
jgi:hypothetical protein